jgi:hypothetical protein
MYINEREGERGKKGRDTLTICSLQSTTIDDKKKRRRGKKKKRRERRGKFDKSLVSQPLCLCDMLAEKKSVCYH